MSETEIWFANSLERGLVEENWLSCEGQMQEKG